LGVYDWLHIPIPIWIQVESIYGVVRLRVQFIPEAPFIRNVSASLLCRASVTNGALTFAPAQLTFTLCGVPSVEISAIPMSRKLPNVLDLPFISYFVKMAIAAGRLLRFRRVMGVAHAK
jgi:Ca2+-dependent lipid-binding protein